MRLETTALTAISGVLILAAGNPGSVNAFSAPPTRPAFAVLKASTRPEALAATGFIDTELRGAAMKLHTKKQAPKEGKAEEPKNQKPHVTTRADYLSFLVDSKHVFEALEDVVNEKSELAVFRNTGLERTEGLEKDIQFMVQEYGLERPDVGQPGKDYADEIRRVGSEGNIPEFMCHYYNFYFAHTAGGRMIGKQMSAMLLDNITLEFYKWDGDLNEMKARVKGDIEDMAACWSQEEKDECVSATAAAFRGGGGVNSHLSGGGARH